MYYDVHFSASALSLVDGPALGADHARVRPRLTGLELSITLLSAYKVCPVAFPIFNSVAYGLPHQSMGYSI